jgi:putative phosphoribosyl transferase
MTTVTHQTSSVSIPVGRHELAGELTIPAEARGVVLFAHGSGSSRHSPRNQYVARVLQDATLGTLLFDLLTADEEAQEYYTRHLRFDIPLLAERLVAATEWLTSTGQSTGLSLGYFGASTGAAAGLIAAATVGHSIQAVVSRGGRPDLAGEFLERVNSPTLLIVGGDDSAVIELNRAAHRRLRCKKDLILIPGATHLFEEPGTLEDAAGSARDWFLEHFKSRPGAYGNSTER